MSDTTDFKKFDFEGALEIIKKSNSGVAEDKLEAILTKVLEKVQIPGRNGISITGPRGEDGRSVVGKDGRDGVHAPIPKFRVGSVVAGETAAVQLKRDDDEDFGFILSFTLPRGLPGERGEKSTVPGIQGRPGRDGESPSPEAVEAVVRRILLAPANVEKFRGPAGITGEQGASIKGDKGDAAMTREEIVQVLIETLNTTGVLTEQAQKLLRIRAKLHQAKHEADARHISMVSDIIKNIDKEF